MPPNQAVNRLKDILEAIGKVQEYSKDDPDLSQEVILEAVSYNLAVIGEAIKALPQEVRDLAPQADWSPAAKMRDVLVHRYFAADRLVIAATVKNDLPALQLAAESVLDQLEDQR